MSVRKLGKDSAGRDRWLARCFRGYGPDAKRLEHSTVKPTKREAEAWLAEERRKLGLGTWVEPSKETLAAYAERWIAGRLVNSDRRQYTRDSYEWTLRSYVLPFLGAVRLDRLTTPVIQDWLDRLIQQKSKRGTGPESDRPTLSTKSVRYARCVLSAVLSDARRDGLIARNPATDELQIRQTPKRPARWLDREEFLRLLDANAFDPFMPLWALIGFSGLRLGEALALTWGETVDLDAGLVRVEHSLTPTKESPGWELTPPKTEKSRRTIPLSPQAVAALESHRSRQQVERVIAGDRWIDCGHAFAFTDAKGRPLTREDMPRRLKAACVRAGLPVITPRDLRHSHASMLLAMTGNLKLVSERLGHAGVAITGNVYAHIASQQMREVAQQFGEYMRLSEKAAQ